VNNICMLVDVNIVCICGEEFSAYNDVVAGQYIEFYKDEDTKTCKKCGRKYITSFSVFLKENKMTEPTKIIWHEMELVKISDVPGFADWLYGQTLPYVEDDPTPTDWAYEWDYDRFINHLPIID
jgi:hypothetical protein